MNPIFIFIILVTFLNLRTTGELTGTEDKIFDQWITCFRASLNKLIDSMLCI